MKHSRFIFFSALAIFTLGAQGADIYVATTGNDTTGDGSASAPFATIPHALEELGPANDGTIFIGEGTFTVNTALSTTGNIKFIGEGTDKTFITREGTSYANKKLFILQQAGALVADLSITNVYAQNVGGTSGSIVEFPNTTGAGLVSNVVFRGCTAGSSGAGYVIYIGSSASAEVVGCTFDRNTMRDSGGSGCIYANGATKALIENCAFFGNNGFSTGAVRIKNKATVRNCTFVDNETNFTNPGAARGGAVYIESVSSGNTIFDHCVFFGNRAPYDTSALAPDVYYSSTINATFTNCFSHCAWDAEGRAIGPGALFVDQSDFTHWRGGDYRPHGNSRLLQAADGRLIGALAASAATGPAFTPSGPASIALQPGDSIQEAIAAAPAGQTINLAEGVFVVTGRIDILKNIKICGAGADRTFLTRTDTNLKSTRFLSIGHPKAVVSGLCISNVLAQAGYQPGALFIWARGGRLVNSRIYGCTGGAATTGGTIGMAGGTNSVISHCIIDANKTFGAGKESIVYLYGGVLDNCLVAQNTSFTHGCVSLRGPAEVRNCTIADNTALSKQTSQVCGGIMWNYSDFSTANKATVVNTIVARNKADMDTTDGAPEWYRNGGTMAAFTNCFTSCAWGSGVPLVGKDAVAFANADDFANPTSGDYHVGTGSQAFDHGAIYDEIAATDLAGDARAQGAAPDIGCYETAAAEAEVNFSCDNAAFTNVTVTLHPVFIGAEGRTLTCEWTFHNESLAESDIVRTSLGDATFEISFATAGWRSVTLRAYDGATLFAEMTKPSCLHIAMPTVFLAPYDAEVSSAYPYATPETAARTNLAAMVADALHGQTIRLLGGRIDIGGQIDISGLVVKGEGWDSTILTNTPMTEATSWNFADYAGLIRLNASGTALEDLCISNVVTYLNGASLVNLSTGGGAMRRIKVVGCRGGHASNGYLVGLYSANSVVDRCWFANNTVQANGDCGCIYAEAGALVSCTLVDGTRDLYKGGGIIVSGTGTTIRNCTVTRNRLFQNSSWAPTSEATGLDYRSLNGTYPTVQNCVFALNPTPTIAGDGGAAWRGTASHLAAHCVNCAFGGDAAVVGEGSIAVADDDPRLFTDPAAGDMSITHHSPLHDAGLYDPSWMDGATDLAGNPRVDHYKGARGLVDIGCYEAPYVPSATLILLQ